MQQEMPEFPRNDPGRWLMLRTGTFIGRKDPEELSLVCKLLRKQPGKVLISGPSGIGKSAFVQEAAFHLRTA